MFPLSPPSNGLLLLSFVAFKSLSHMLHSCYEGQIVPNSLSPSELFFRIGWFLAFLYLIILSGALSWYNIFQHCGRVTAPSFEIPLRLQAQKVRREVRPAKSTFRASTRYGAEDRIPENRFKHCCQTWRVRLLEPA